MPIGVPRIIYCWGEELPAQWTDIYNFIFRRRMVFLMQYLDDELCNQICGLLINIHMEDRSKELEKKEMEKSSSLSRFKSNQSTGESPKASSKFSAMGGGQKPKSVEDLLTAEDDLAIDQNNTLEQYTLQKITMEWLNWNAQFFDYSDEPYLFYLADILSKDFSKDTGNLMYDNSSGLSGLANSKYNRSEGAYSPNSNQINKNFFKLFKNFYRAEGQNKNGNLSFMAGGPNQKFVNNELDVYSPFRLLANFAAKNYDLNQINPLLSLTQNNNPAQVNKIFEQYSKTINQNKSGISKLLNNLSQENLINQVLHSPDAHKQTSTNELSSHGSWAMKSSENVLSQRRLKREYLQDRVQNPIFDSKSNSKKLSNLDLVTSFNAGKDFNSYNAETYDDYRQFYRKQTERTIQEEESKKVFVIINSFGGSVGNGITVHDALQFIKAGSLTLGLGVAASAASLVLAGGTIGERYVTEGCHVMIHQPEGGLNGQASDIWIDANEIMKIRLDVAEIYSLSTYRPRHKILRDLDRDFYLTATETIQYGLADEIATNEVMHEIIEMTSKVWDFHDAQQQRLLETRESASAGLDTQTQN
jgi:ATP-dependent Clp protease protease subunit